MSNEKRRFSFNPIIIPQKPETILPPMHQAARSDAPFVRAKSANVLGRIRAQSAALFGETIETKPRPPSESNFDRMWRHLDEVSVAWFDREDMEYMIFFFALTVPIEIDPAVLRDELVRVRVKYGGREIRLLPDLGPLFVRGRKLIVRTNYVPTVTQYLERHRERATVSLERKSSPKGKARKLGRAQHFTPVRAALLPRVC